MQRENVDDSLPDLSDNGNEPRTTPDSLSHSTQNPAGKPHTSSNTVSPDASQTRQSPDNQSSATAVDTSTVSAQNIIGEHIAKRPKRESPFTRPAQMRITDPQPSHKWIRAIVDVFNVLIFVATSFGSLFILQWGVNGDQRKTITETIAITIPDVFGTDPNSRRFILLLNLLIIAALYLFLLFLCNSLWVSTGLIAIVMVIFGVSNRIKIELRSEPVLPSDITLAFHNTKSVAGFIPESSYGLIAKIIAAAIGGILLAIICAWFFGKAQPLHITSPLKRIGMQILIACAPAGLLASFIAGSSSSDGWGRRLATKMGDTPMMWEAAGDARVNGVLYTFIRNSFTKVMDKPAGYSQQKMNEVARK